MIDEHGKAITFLSLKEKGLFWRKVPLQSCFTLVLLFTFSM